MSRIVFVSFVAPWCECGGLNGGNQGNDKSTREYSFLRRINKGRLKKRRFVTHIRVSHVTCQSQSQLDLIKLMKPTESHLKLTETRRTLFVSDAVVPAATG